MEDALVLNICWEILSCETGCLNPCFNGRCTRTIQVTWNPTTDEIVLILVLMEDALVLT